MKFYINSIGNKIEGLPELPYNNGQYVGLFSQCQVGEDGNFCGYYSSSSYINTNLHAVAIYENGCYRNAKRLEKVIRFDKFFQEIPIETHMWTNVIEAESIEDAISKFEISDWREWKCEIDEITEYPIQSM